VTNANGELRHDRHIQTKPSSESASTQLPSRTSTPTTSHPSPKQAPFPSHYLKPTPTSFSTKINPRTKTPSRFLTTRKGRKFLFDSAVDVLIRSHCDLPTLRTNYYLSFLPHPTHMDNDESEYKELSKRIIEDHLYTSINRFFLFQHLTSLANNAVNQRLRLFGRFMLSALAGHYADNLHP